MGAHDPLVEGHVLLGKYRIDQKLGEGGMAVVYQATNLGAAGFERPVVIKVIKPRLAEQPGVVEQFVREASVGATLDHPNIVQTMDLGESDGKLYMVLELVQGKDLAAVVHRARRAKRVLGPELVSFICIDVCKALECSHDHYDDEGRHSPVIHRDISPQNILLSRDGHVKLADFGMARALGTARLTRQGVVKGKLSYMSPEQSRGKEVNPTSDLFSLGVVMWETLTGRRLFLAKDPIVTVKRVRACEVPRLEELAPHVPPELANIVAALIVADPADRPRTATVVRRALQTFLRGARPVEPTAIADLVEAYFPSRDDPTLNMAVSDLSFDDEGEGAGEVGSSGAQDDISTAPQDALEGSDPAPTHTLLMFGPQAEALSEAFAQAQEAAKERQNQKRDDVADKAGKNVQPSSPQNHQNALQKPGLDHDPPWRAPAAPPKATLPGVGATKPTTPPPTLIVESTMQVRPTLSGATAIPAETHAPVPMPAPVPTPQPVPKPSPAAVPEGLFETDSENDAPLLPRSLVLSLLIGVPLATIFGVLVFWLVSKLSQ